MVRMIVNEVRFWNEYYGYGKGKASKVRRQFV